MKPNTITIIVITLIIAAGGGYWYFTTQSGNQAPLTESVPSGNVAQNQFESLVSQLQPISFNVDIFSDPRFTALISLITPVAAEPSGRIDPFAPLGSTAAATTTAGI